MLHEEIAQFLRQDEVRGGRLAANADEDFVRGGETGDVVCGGGSAVGTRRGGDFAKAGDCVGSLTFGEEGDGDGDDFVAEGFVVGEGGVANVEDGGVSAVEPRVINSEEFAPRAGVWAWWWEAGGCGVAGVRSSHDTVGDFEVGHAGCKRPVYSACGCQIESRVAGHAAVGGFEAVHTAVARWNSNGASGVCTECEWD